MKEEYRPVGGYEGLYEISNYGNIRSLRTNRLMKKQIHSRGYYQVMLCKNGKAEHKRIGRMVAEAFIPNDDNLPTVNHKDTNKKNDRVDNLEWMSCGDNVRHAHKNGLVKAKLSMDIAEQLRMDYKMGLKGWALSKKYNICVATVYEILNNTIYKQHPMPEGDK